MEINLAMRVSAITIIVNIFLSIAKLISGLLGGSAAMISDAVHSASDVLSTLVVIIGLKAAGKKPDSSHQYGHERLECIASIILSALLLATGIGIGYGGVQKIISGDYGSLQIPTMLPLVAAIASIVIKEWMFRYTRRVAKKLNSGAMMADAWHHRSDALSSVGSFVGILGARLGAPVLDPIATVIICIFIMKAAYDIFRDGVAKLTDRACEPEMENEIRELILSHDGVLELDLLKTRLFGSKIYIDVEISAKGDQTLEEAHLIAQQVHDSIEKSFPNVKHCMIHVNPAEVDYNDSE